MDSNHVTNVIPLRAEEDRDLESPTHTPPTAYIWCQRGGIKMDKISEDSSVQTDTRKDLFQKSRRITYTFLFLKSREPQILEPQTHGQYGLPN